MGYERASMNDKRDALVSFIKDILSNDFGESFNYFKYARTQFLHMTNRLERLSIQENQQGEIRQADIFWQGPNDGNSPDRDLAGLERLGGSQLGSVQEFAIVLHMGVSTDSSGEIDNRETFEGLFESQEPKGLLVQVRETDYIQTQIGGEDITLILSNPANPVFPATPRPLQSGDREFAHYGEFSVFLTDM